MLVSFFTNVRTAKSFFALIVVTAVFSVRSAQSLVRPFSSQRIRVVNIRKLEFLSCYEGFRLQPNLQTRVEKEAVQGSPYFRKLRTVVGLSEKAFILSLPYIRKIFGVQEDD